MKQRNFMKRLIFGVIAAAIGGCSLAAGSISPVRAAALSEKEIRAQLDKLEKEEKQINSRIGSLSGDIKEQKKQKELLEKKIENTTAQITLLNGQIDELEHQIKDKDAVITEKTETISEKERAIEDRSEQLRQRLRAIDKSGRMSPLQMLLETNDYTDYLMKAKIARRIADRDQKLMDDLERQLWAIRTEKAELDTQKGQLSAKNSELQKLKKQVDLKKKDMEKSYTSIRYLINQMEKDVNVLRANLQQVEKEQKQLDKQLQAVLDKMPVKGKYDGGTMFWPVPTVKTTSDLFGGKRNHKGIDIANHPTIPVEGQNIVAAADGVVIYANGTNTWGGGYGYFTMVDHGLDARGKRIVTLYAHCSVMYARVGQQVKGGETVLAKAGHTGRVSGPHLHFEVREDNVPVDPFKNGYLKRL